MAKLRFIVVGSGWRSLFYWRIAQALPETGILVRDLTVSCTRTLWWWR